MGVGIQRFEQQAGACTIKYASRGQEAGDGLWIVNELKHKLSVGYAPAISADGLKHYFCFSS